MHSKQKGGNDTGFPANHNNICFYCHKGVPSNLEYLSYQNHYADSVHGVQCGTPWFLSQ